MAEEEVLIDENDNNVQESAKQKKSPQDGSILNNLFNFDQDLLLLLLILLIFFSKRDVFSEQLQFLNQEASNIKNYLEAADATIQALDQASQMPKQILN